jgi:hypothetical protein
MRFGSWILRLGGLSLQSQRRPDFAMLIAACTGSPCSPNLLLGLYC